MVLSGTLFWYLQKVVSVYVGYYQVRYFVLTDGNKFIAHSERKTNIMSLEALINGTTIYI